jgi:aminopeptidase N
MAAPKTLRLQDYKEPEFTTDKVHLDFDIYEDATYVTSRVAYKRSPNGKNTPELVLHAENPNPDGKDFIKSVSIDGVTVFESSGAFTIDHKKNELRIPIPPWKYEVEVEIETYLEPQHNTKLEGLYQSDSCVVTQCEAEGFRRITPFLDRPDVMAEYTVHIEAPEDTHPVLLSNGNRLNKGSLGNGRHWAEFHDPHPKPSYLFATANGNLEYVKGEYTTQNGQGRKVNCRIFTEVGQKDKAQHALDALILSMKWDEDVFECEYDLDDYNVVAIAKFNAGAMENKGLNVFRDSLILASPETATDANYQSIIDVEGHEYFHNYSGNRVTLANWFNISLKEGLTVVREQMFTAFTTSAPIERINSVKYLRDYQFPEDDGPLRHPVLPQEVDSVDNCYSMTIYQKGAEVIRMMGQLMGEDKLIDGVKHFFKKHDGQAVTIKEFVKCMEDVSGLNFSDQFNLWYTQSGRPKVKASGEYDAASETYTLTLEQSITPDKEQPDKKAMMIPIKMGLVDKNGNDMHEEMLVLTQKKQMFTFENIAEEPDFHSLLRGFSAPIDLDPGLTEAQLHSQLLNDNDGFNRWDASQKIALKEMKRLYDEYVNSAILEPLDQKYIDTIKTLLNDKNTDPALLARTIERPSITELEAVIGKGNVVPSAVAAIDSHIDKSLSKTLFNDYMTTFNHTHDGTPYEFKYDEVGKRDLKRAAVEGLLANGGRQNLKAAKEFYFKADNMTDQDMALKNLVNHPSKERDTVLKDFYNRFNNDQLTIQKWFRMQATSKNDNVINDLTNIMNSGVYDWQNPGHVGSVVNGFATNYEQFHKVDGSGYEFVADAVIKLNNQNPSVASGIIENLTEWRNYSDLHQKLMIKALDRIAAEPKVSKDVLDKLNKALPDQSERQKLGLASSIQGNTHTGNRTKPPSSAP